MIVQVLRALTCTKPSRSINNICIVTSIFDVELEPSSQRVLPWTWTQYNLSKTVHLTQSELHIDDIDIHDRFIIIPRATVS